VKHVFHQSPMTGQLEKTRGFFIPAMKFTCKEYFSTRTRQIRDIYKYVCSSSSKLHTLRKTVLIPCIVPTYFLLPTLYIYRKIKRLILQRRPSMKRTSQIVIYEEKELARRLCIYRIPVLSREHKDILLHAIHQY